MNAFIEYNLPLTQHLIDDWMHTWLRFFASLRMTALGEQWIACCHTENRS